MEKVPPFPLFSKTLAIFYRVSGMLPVCLNPDKRDYGLPSKYLLAYGTVLVLAFNIHAVSHNVELYSLWESLDLTKLEILAIRLTYNTNLTVFNVIIFATFFQCNKGTFRNILQKLDTFDLQYALRPSEVPTKKFSYIITGWIMYLSVFFIPYTVFAEEDLLSGAASIIRTTMLISMASILYLFLVLMDQIKTRYKMLNTTLSQFQTQKKPLEVKFLREISGYIHCYDVSAVQKTSDLYKLLGETAKLINSFFKVQLLAFFVYIISYLAFLPYAISWMNQQEERISFVSRCTYPLNLAVVLYEFYMVIQLSTTTTKEAKNTSKIVISLLNSEIVKYWNSELKSLHLQLPHHVHPFTVFDLFEVDMDCLVSIPSLMVGYWMVFVNK